MSASLHDALTVVIKVVNHSKSNSLRDHLFPAFSRVSQMLSKDRNRLDIVKRGDLRLSLTSIEPNINKLAEKNRPLGSH
ncbi:hypothetical protein QYM36_002352 [Artemia franciscana]|uniref:Uncharacterized protein n=1 Tax=Artemia franciscana TaxID=6661 RepID=A0AA88I792_ARTSF|nr:hypothetical protein QYM36_002352 [Artemia franciscana]